MIRSTPPVSSNFAEMPVPAPPPIIGRSAATILCSRSRTWLRVNAIVEMEHQRPPAPISFVGVHCRSLNQLKHHSDSFSSDRRIIDIKIELYHWIPRLE